MMKDKRREKVPIVIPNAEMLTKEELTRLRRNEAMRRSRARSRGELPAPKLGKQELRKITTGEMVELSQDTRNLAVQILNQKLLLMQTDSEMLAKTSIKDLATVFGILVDKNQLLNGLSTSNISIHSKVDVNMTADKAMEALSRMREHYQENNE